MDKVSLHPYTPADDALLRSMELLYSHDFSEWVGLSFKENGQFLSDAQFAQYFIDVYRAFVIRCEGKPAGFALVDNRSQLSGEAGVHDMLQFFVLRGFRRAGVGAAAAKAVFAMFPGPWEVRQIDENLLAQAFWRRVVGEFTQDHFTEARWQDADGGGIVQRFVVPVAERAGGRLT
jgi:predicted acetyltransferase